MIDTLKLRCPVCSSKLTHNSNHFQCLSCDFIYFHNIASASVAVIIKNDKILLLNRTQEPRCGKLHLPGGFVTKAETAEKALIREVKEETNLDIVKTKYLFSIPNTYNYMDVSYDVLDLYFKTTVSNYEIKLNNESSKYDWFPKESIQNKNIAFPSVKKALNRLGYLQ